MFDNYKVIICGFCKKKSTSIFLQTEYCKNEYQIWILFYVGDVRELYLFQKIKLRQNENFYNPSEIKKVGN